MSNPSPKAFPVSWDQFHRDCKALAWRLAGMAEAKGEWKAIVSITRGGLVPGAIIARELGIDNPVTIKAIQLAGSNGSEMQFGEWDGASLINTQIAARRAYAAAFGRAHMEDGNIFWSPRDLTRIFAGFRPISGFLHYRTLQDYLATYPAYLPYDGGRSVPGPGRPKRFYYRAAASLGSASRYVLPNLAAVWERVPE